MTIAMPRFLFPSVGLTDILIVIFAFVILSVIRHRSRRGLPPGPPGLPLVANAFDIPRERSWEKYRELAFKYGDVVSLQALGQTFIILNSSTASNDLLDKRTGWDWALVMTSYGDRWRRVRRLIWQHFHPNALSQYRATQQVESRRFLRRLYEEQSTVDLDSQIKMLLSSTLLTIVHGLPHHEITRRFVDIVTASEAGFEEVFGPTGALVNFIPWLRYLPSWFPGAGWQKKLSEWRSNSDALLNDPFDAGKAAIARGDGKSSILSELLENPSKLEGVDAEIEERNIKEMTSSAFGAGTDTTAGTLFAFICAMLVHPEVQRRAQAELDAVVGPDRLPEHADRAQLPYVNAILKETLRWHIVSPLGVPHRCMEEDEYRGWRIPEGALVIANIWGILHDPEVYPEPEAFNPDRFLQGGELRSDILDPSNVVFGFGRRICPGRYFAEDSLFLNMASILHVFDILPALDKSGKPIPVDVKTSSGFLSVVEPFEYRIRARSEAALALVQGDI
ncbi:CyP450 monooxygenase [Trametes punicea]|nr:CyP450 monooxygenase [Trametes punicea]